MYYIMVTTSGVDMSMAYYTLQYSGEFMLLKEKLKILLSSKIYRDDLKNIVDRHCELIELHHILEDVYGLIVLWVSITSAINLCIAIYQTSQVSIIISIFFKIYMQFL